MELMQPHRTNGAQTIPLDWCIKRVQDLGEVITGGTPNTSVAAYWGGQHPWITPTDITHQRDLTESGRMLTDAGLKVIRSLPANSVLVTCIASIGKNAVLRKNGGCNQQINAVIPNEENNPEFLYYMFEAAKIYLQSNAGITATSIVSKAAFQELKFALPLLPEQRAIATALSDVDALIAGLERLIAKKRDIKQAAMQQLLTGQTRLPGFSGEWASRRLGDSVQFLKNGVHSRAELAETGDVKYLHYGDIHGAVSVFLDADHTAMPYLSLLKAAKLDRLQDGDLVFADASEDKDGIGKAVELRGIGEKEVVAGLHTIAARFDNEVLVDGFKAYLPFMPLFSEHLKRLASGTKVYATNRKNIASVELRLPGAAEQIAIATVLSDMDAGLSALEVRLIKTRAIKQGMMQELLTGRTRLV